jgi:hypothetical protein
MRLGDLGSVRRLTLLLLLLLTAPADAATVGLSDNQAATWSDARVHALGLEHARLIVGWDAVTRETAHVDAWLAAVAAAGLEPHVAFQHTRGQDCSTGACSLPSAAQYGAAVAAFRARWPQVRTFTAWNEANHVSQPTADRPDMAAAYYRELAARCGDCQVVAGDVLDSGAYTSWLRQFLAASPAPPQLWGIHNYSDVTYGGSGGTDAVLATVPGRLWMEETGGIVVNRNASGRVTLSYDEARAASSIAGAFAIAAARPRIGRMYVYQWKAGASDRFDSGLLRPDGATRASYEAVRRGIAGVAPAASTTATAIRWAAAWSGGRYVRLTGACRPARTTCTGRLQPALKVTRGSRTRTFKLPARKLRTTLNLRLALPGKARRAMRGARKLRLRLATTLTGATAAQVTSKPIAPR